MNKLWGNIEGIDENKVIPVNDKEKIKINHVEIKALHTPGHAKHHISWGIGDSVFTGDVAGAKINNGLSALAGMLSYLINSFIHLLQAVKVPISRHVNLGLAPLDQFYLE